MLGDYNPLLAFPKVGPLAQLGLARAEAVQAKNLQDEQADAARSRALSAYQRLLAVWKGADPDLPVLKQVRAEYAGLQ